MLQLSALLVSYGLVSIALPAPPGTAIHGDPQASAPARIQLRRATFDPLVTEPSFAESVLTDGGQVFIVQFVTQPRNAYRRALAAAGATLQAYVPDHAYLVRMDAPVRAAVEALPCVRWIGPYHPEYRLDPVLLESLSSGGFAGRERFNVLLLERGPESKRRAARAIERLGGSVSGAEGDGVVLTASLSADELAAVACLDDVLFVDPWGAPELDTNLQRQISGADYVEMVAGFRGQGVRGEVFDQGFDLTHQEFQAPPLIVHGTLGGTIAHGNPVTSLVFATGINPAAKGILPDGQGIVAAFGSVANRFAHTQELLASPYFAVFQSNSWGGPRTTHYTVKSAEMDDIIFQTDLLIVQSQGAGGGPTNQESRPEAWAKNIVGVGGVRFNNTLSKADDTWNGAGSVGPAEDGRIKPDTLHIYDGVIGAGAPPDKYLNFGGTSASTAVVAGYFGLVFQMWHTGIFGNPTPGATVFDNRPHSTTARALFFNSACQYPFSGATHDLNRFHQGWGLADVARLYDERDLVFVVDEKDVVQEQQSTSYALEVAPGEDEFRATLVYLDLPGTPSATVHRVNDLDLRVTSPSGTQYWGNNGLLVGNFSIAGGAPDDLNPVENVFVQAPESGAWVVEVIASEINADSHVETAAVDADYALVVHPVQPLHETFCTAKTNLVCGPATISAAGVPSATATSGFVVSAKPARGTRLGILLYNTSQAAGVPFAQTGTLCVQPAGIRRGGPTSSLGTPGQCDGVLSIDMNAFARGLWVVPPSGAIPPNNPAAFLSQPGTTVFCQYWGRDSVQTGELLSDGLGYIVQP